jgi:predicted nucleic acid-binding protein
VGLTSVALLCRAAILRGIPNRRLLRISRTQLKGVLRFSMSVLVQAKRRMLIPTIKAELDALRDVAGFRISEGLYWRVLKDEKEA